MKLPELGPRLDEMSRGPFQPGAPRSVEISAQHGVVTSLWTPLPEQLTGGWPCWSVPLPI